MILEMKLSSPVVVVVFVCVCRLACAQSEQQTTPLPTEATGIPQSVLIVIISTFGTLLGITCTCIIGLLCFRFTRINKDTKSNSALHQDQNQFDLNPARVFTKPPVTGSSVHDVSSVVEILKSSRTDDGENTAGFETGRSFATLVDRPVVNPDHNIRRSDDWDDAPEEAIVTYMASYQRRFAEVQESGV